MSEIKTRILQTSLIIFNEQGYIKTTLRNIASALNISQGNLNYHFKTKQDIIEALYFELVRKMDAEMIAISQNQTILNLLYDSAYRSMKIFYEYRFLMRDFYLIMRENKSLKNHYTKLQQLREDQFLTLFHSLTEHGVLRKEEFTDEYKRLYERMNILGDNWINTLDLLDKNLEKPVLYYCNLLFELLYPYLTKKGKEEYKKIIELN